MQETSSADAARPVAVPGRIIGGRELPTSPLTTDSDGSPYADQRPRQKQPTRAMTRTNHTANWHLLAKSPLTTDSSDRRGGIKNQHCRTSRHPVKTHSKSLIHSSRPRPNAPAAFQQLRSVHSSASASKQHPIKNSEGGASSTKDRQKQPAHHLESEGYPGVSSQAAPAPASLGFGPATPLQPGAPTSAQAESGPDPTRVPDPGFARWG